MHKTAAFIVFSTLISLFMIACDSNTGKSKFHEELDKLDRCLENMAEYEKAKTHRLDSLHKLLENTPETDSYQIWKYNMDLGDEYRAFCSDSATYYYDRALKTAQLNGMGNAEIDSRICLANAQGAAGLFTLAYISLTSLDTLSLNKEQRLEYAKAARQLYSYMHEYAYARIRSWT